MALVTFLGLQFAMLVEGGMPGVQASRLLGFGPAYVFRRHLWPELAPMLLTLAACGAATAIMMIEALGFVSVRMRPPTPRRGPPPTAS